MDYNYHTHTYRCHHATDTPEEYVLRAISGGVKRMGFSDHFPLRFSDGKESTFRVPVDEVEEYVNDVLYLKEKYKDKIEIRLGFEMEYYPHMFDEMLKNAKKYGAEYLICGQHFFAPENIDTTPTGRDTDDIGSLERYVKLVIEAIKCGAFTYIAHPDLIKYIGDDDAYCAKIREIAEASKTYNVPLEINFLGIRTGRIYPRDLFWQIVGEVGAPVTFGFDAHSAVDAYDPDSVKKAMELVSRYNLNYIGEPEIIMI